MYRPGIGATVTFPYLQPDPDQAALTSVNVTYGPPVTGSAASPAGFDIQTWLGENKITVFAAAGTILLLAVLKGRR